MTVICKRLVFLFAISLPAIAIADQVTCESQGGDKKYCDMDTRGGVHVYKNLSKTDCVEDENWGETRHGVWVDNGCRTVFVSGSRRDYDRDRDYDRHRDDYHREQNRPPPPPPTPALHCPPGTHPSTHRCTKEERRRGCKDYGGPNGQGCSNF